MKRIKLMTILLAAATAVVITGCSGKNTDVTSETRLVELEGQTLEVASQKEEKESSVAVPDTSEPEEKQEQKEKQQDPQPAQDPKQEQQPAKDEGKEDAAEVVATIKVSFSYSEGTPDTIEVMDITGVSGKPDDNDRSIIRGYDDAGKLVYKRTDTGAKDDKGTLNVTITYEFYSLDHDFDYRFEPLEPENGGDIQTLKGSYSQKGGASKDLTFETAGIRGQTGIWYAGVCSCRKGTLGDYSLE